MQNGFIIEIIKAIVNSLYYFNLVELFKTIAKKLAQPNARPSIKIKYSNFAIDFFILLKWLFVFVVWKNGIANTFITGTVFYLVFTNIYTYFYYHVWVDSTSQSITYERNIRRFVNLILAYSFSNYCYGYLYAVPFYNDMTWGLLPVIDKDHNALLFSIANSLTSSVAGVATNTTIGNFISVSQVSLSFIFISIILSKSIPQN